MSLACTSRQSSIEPLESRIAPALLVYGANLLGKDSPLTGETSAGDNSVTLIKVLSGQAMVWYDGERITTISVGPGAKLEITGNVGDIVANLTADGHLTDSDNDPTNGEDGGVLLANDILGIKTRSLSGENGDISNIITGGSIANINVTGSISGIYAGDGVFRPESIRSNGSAFSIEVTGDGRRMDVNPVEPGYQETFDFTKTGATLKPGASISNITLDKGVSLQVIAGNGSLTGLPSAGNGVAGGSISGVRMISAEVAANAPVGTPSYAFLAGHGGDGKVGGMGGTISDIVEKSAAGNVIIRAGDGGAGSGGAGGGGGSILNLEAQSPSAQYAVRTGDGGAGTPGGAGGRTFNLVFANRTPLAGVILEADFNNDGRGDIVVADAATGDMVINIALPGGGFEQLVQHDNQVAITGAANSPVDGLVEDMNGDGEDDIVILYRDGTMAAFLNDGQGNFYNEVDSKYDTVEFSLGFKASQFAQLTDGSAAFTAVENVDGKGTLHGFIFFVENNAPRVTVLQGTLDFNRPIVDVEGNFVGLSDGTINKFSFGQKELFAGPVIKPSITGGLEDLDINADGTRLLALSGIGKSMAVYDISSQTPVLLTPIGGINLSGVEGRPSLAKFIADDDDTREDDIVVLSSTVTSGQLTLVSGPITVQPPAAPLPYELTTVNFDSEQAFNDFVPRYDSNTDTFSLVAVSGTLNSFTEVTGFFSDEIYALPFASKQVALETGKGGKGLDLGSKLGKGGAGGSIINTTVEAQVLTIISGDGGDSTNGAAGAGGSISNSAPFKSAGGETVMPFLKTESALVITVGSGGSPTGAGGKSASGGAGGGVSGIKIIQVIGDINLTSGHGGIGKGGAAGAGGDISRLTLESSAGGLNLIAGYGGESFGAGNGGLGGSIKDILFKLDLDEDAEKVEDSYLMNVTAGAGGNSSGGFGGAGGDLELIKLELDGPERSYSNPNVQPPLVDAHIDSTLAVTIIAGAAGHGAKGGGAGGDVKGLQVDVTWDQIIGNGVFIDYATLYVEAGAGGNASAGNGGAGGAVVFTRPITGITIADPDQAGFDPSVAALQVYGGAGGNGSVAGGAGGSVSNLVSQNSIVSDGRIVAAPVLYSARLVGGAGGDGGTGNGGAGGGVVNTLTATGSGFLEVEGGEGGDSVNAKGGAGGGVIGSELGVVVNGAPVGMYVAGGDGGAGKTAGGAGGTLNGLRINTPQSYYPPMTPPGETNLSALLFAGNGGVATGGGGVGGKGGDILNISQAKDYNSSVNVVQAGNGGAALQGKGGAGGNVNNYKTVGFIGRHSDDVSRLGIFDTYFNGVIAQGLFVGRGGDGLTDGVNGSVTGVVARGIAAIAAAIDTNTGLFAPAAKVSNVTASVIGFDADLDGVFDTEGANGASPSSVVPVDGFILATALSKVFVTRPAFTFAA